ncbi:MAG: hypothetical protein HC804_14740 [Anaerolineae bacterium]|nr:hypothetical protein [Anaerolineae bacterium]
MGQLVAIVTLLLSGNESDMENKFDRSGCLLALLSPLFVIVLIEIGLRIIKPPVTFAISGSCLVQEDAQVGYRYRPHSTSHLQQYNEIDNVIVINSLGFHDIERDLTIDQYRILALGDSFTTAGQVPVAAGWTQTIEQQLADTAVINLGVDGFGTDRQLKLLEQYAPILKPEAVILAFYENDVQDVLAQVTLDCYDGYLLIYQTEAQKEQFIAFLEDHEPTPAAFWLAEHSSFYRVMAVLFAQNGFLLVGKSISPPNIDLPLEPLPEAPPGLMPDLFAQFEALAEEYDFQIIVVPVPGKKEPTQSLAILEQQLDGAEWPHIQIVDVYPMMEEQFQSDGREHADLYFVYDGHFNEYGYALFGQAAATVLEEQLALEKRVE